MGTQFRRYCWVHSYYSSYLAVCPKCRSEGRFEQKGDDWLMNDLPIEILKEECMETKT